MSSLLKELQKLKPKFPEAEFHVPEWGRSLRLRAFSMREARALRETNEAEGDDRATLRMLAHSTIDGDDRPLANEQGIELLDELSGKTLGDMARIVAKLNGFDQDPEKNLGPRADASGSSTDSPSRSGEPLLN